MVEIEIDLSGMEIEVVCPKCKGDGKLVSSYYKAFDTQEKEWNKKNNEIICPMCMGKETITVTAKDVIYIDYELEPMYNEGMI